MPDNRLTADSDKRRIDKMWDALDLVQDYAIMGVLLLIGVVSLFVLVVLIYVILDPEQVCLIAEDGMEYCR